MPVILPLQTFTAPDGTLITGYNNQFILHPSYSVTTEIINGRIIPSSTANRSAYYYDAVPTSADQRITWDHYVVSNFSVNLFNGCLLRFDPLLNTYYMARYYQSTGAWELYRANDSAQTWLADYGAALPVGATFSLGFTAKTNGNQVDLELKINGVSRITYSDTAANRIIDVNRVGFRISGSTPTEGHHLDNLYAETIETTSVSVNDKVTKQALVTNRSTKPAIMKSTVRKSALLTSKKQYKFIVR